MKRKRKARQLLIFIPLIAVAVIAPTACHHGYYGGYRGFSGEEHFERGGGGRHYAHRGYGHGRSELHERRGYWGRPGYYHEGYLGWGFSGHYRHHERHDHEHGHHPSDGDRYREMRGFSQETKDRENWEESD